MRTCFETEANFPMKLDKITERSTGPRQPFFLHHADKFDAATECTVYVAVIILQQNGFLCLK